MSEAAAEAQVTEAPAPAAEDLGAPDSEAEMPDFNIYSDDSEESQVETSEAKPEAKEVKPDDGWSARVKKDRVQRKKEIELKRKEQELSEKEQHLSSKDEIRKAFISNPEEFLKSQGIDPIDFYSDWTSRLANGVNEVGSDLRISETERELKGLKEELQKRDELRANEENQRRQQREVGEYHSRIDTFMESDSAKGYPLTVQQCSSQDVAQGIAAYYQKTGVELGFKEAFEKIESGLRGKENDIFNDPKVIAKFKEYHGLDASNKKGKRSHLTLSSNLQTQPTKTPSDDMSDDEIYDFWKGKLFT
tara:strand:- start:234 stop:1148 length:915 start_codon:yes stop_codon:yes gene_type:complete